jgi:membrane-bound lytic murein transglycosylase D
MEKNAAEYGLEGIQMDPPLEYDTVEIAAKTGVALVSDITETSLPELAALNPAILKNMIPAGYSLHVPKGTGNQLMAGLETIPPEHRDTWRMHRLGTGETLAEVGKRYGIPLNNLVAVNNLRVPEASDGDRLIIPAATRAEPAPKRAGAQTARRRTGASAAGSRLAVTRSQAAAGAKVSAARSQAPAAKSRPSASKSKSKAKRKANPAPKSPVIVASHKVAPKPGSAANSPVVVARARLQ